MLCSVNIFEMSRFIMDCLPEDKTVTEEKDTGPQATTGKNESVEEKRLDISQYTFQKRNQ